MKQEYDTVIRSAVIYDGGGGDTDDFEDRVAAGRAETRPTTFPCTYVQVANVASIPNRRWRVSVSSGTSAPS